MMPRPAQYLLRFDDLCPTMSRAGWEPFLRVIEDFRLQPIVAVVPDNQDSALKLSDPDPDFWPKMRAMEAEGATIALHGYRHLCESRGRGMLPLHDETEFAGVSLEVQREWIHRGLEILRDRGLNPRLWTAPRHGFDANTLRALHEEGIMYLSDGFARTPFLREGLTWIPQQLWRPVSRDQGLWTICMHSNTADSGEVSQLRSFVQQHHAQFTSFDRVVEEYRPSCLGVGEQVFEAMSLARIRVSRWRKTCFRRRRTS
jgi:predicted deacetylase